jgi:membrane protease YdiL (CAAX protease family)
MNNQNLNKLISRILIAFGVMFINLAIFTYLAQIICENVYHIHVANFLGSTNFDHPKPNELGALRLFFAINSIGTFIVSSFIIALIFKENPVEYLGLKSFPKPIYYLIIPILLLISMPFLSWLIDINSKLQLPDFLSSIEHELKSLETKNDNLYKIMLTMPDCASLFINIIIMALIPAFGEELFCRGVLLNITYDYSGKIFKSIIIVAVIFTLFHLQFYKFMPMMILAILLGMFINWTQSIWASILFHFLNNTLAIVGSFYNQRGIKNFMTNEHASVPLILTLTSFVLTLFCLIWLNKYSKKLILQNNE